MEKLNRIKLFESFIVDDENEYTIIRKGTKLPEDFVILNKNNKADINRDKYVIQFGKEKENN